MGSKINVPYKNMSKTMNRYRVTILATPDSTTYSVDTIVETKQSAKAVINRFLRVFPDCYEISVDLVK